MARELERPLSRPRPKRINVRTEGEPSELAQRLLAQDGEAHDAGDD
jgi:hypothetical protein